MSKYEVRIVGENDFELRRDDVPIAHVKPIAPANEMDVSNLFFDDDANQKAENRIENLIGNNALLERANGKLAKKLEKAKSKARQARHKLRSIKLVIQS